MGKPDFRVVGESGSSTPARSKATVAMPLRDVFPLLLHAHRHNYAWLKDLADDEIVVTPDLADILRSFSSILRDKRGA